jgi:hypothetical protein
MTIRERPLADAREVIVVQLRLLDLMVRRERDPVSMDVATRAALIDLMARVVVAVFHEEVGANDRHNMQSQDQTGAPGSQSDCVSPTVQRKTSHI